MVSVESFAGLLLLHTVLLLTVIFLTQKLLQLMDAFKRMEDLFLVLTSMDLPCLQKCLNK
jgi:hypothetical protein